LRSSLAICGLYASEATAQTVSQVLRGTVSTEAVAVTYLLNHFVNVEAFLQFVATGNHPVDCLILEAQPKLQSVLQFLSEQKLFFPVVCLTPPDQSTTKETDYHSAIVYLPNDQLSQIGAAVDQAVAQFIQLSPVRSPTIQIPDRSLLAQQIRLSEKLKERLGYLGVYYKRNPENFFRHMTPVEREELLQHLESEYREIVLTYFLESANLNDRLDNFVNMAFFADVSVAQIVEIHMSLMDEFSKQLKLEGRSDEILQDYRLTLIDVIAHLCEMYRRSIPRES
jgi:circadian clock protein KaiA